MYFIIGGIMLVVAVLMIRKAIQNHLADKLAAASWQTSQRLLNEDVENLRNSLRPPSAEDKPLFTK